MHVLNIGRDIAVPQIKSLILMETAADRKI